jgi:hypothetical protein
MKTYQETLRMCARHIQSMATYNRDFGHYPVEYDLIGRIYDKDATTFRKDVEKELAIIGGIS